MNSQPTFNATNSSMNSLYLYFGQLTQWTSNDPSVLQNSIGSQVLVFDANADLQLDLFGVSKSLETKTYWINNGKGYFTLYVTFI